MQPPHTASLLPPVQVQYVVCTLAAPVRPRSLLAVHTYGLAHAGVVSMPAWRCRWNYHAAGAGGLLELRSEAAEAERLLDAALRLDPANPLAHHLRIHLTEATRPLPRVPPLPAALLLRPVISGPLLLLVCASAVNFAVGLTDICSQLWLSAMRCGRHPQLRAWPSSSCVGRSMGCAAVSPPH